jgi:hypothetical protein
MTESSASATAPVLSLDPAVIGQALKLLPIISRRIGHKSVRATLGYGAPTTPETEFVRDLLTMTTPEVIAKWYGDEVADLYERQAAENVAAMITRKRRRPAVDPAA